MIAWMSRQPATRLRGALCQRDLSQPVSGRASGIQMRDPSHQRLALTLTAPSCQVVPHFPSEKSLTPEPPAGSFHPPVLLGPGIPQAQRPAKRGPTLPCPRILLHQIILGPPL